MNGYDPLHRLVSPPGDEFRGNIHELLRRRGVVREGFRLLPEDGMEWAAVGGRLHGRFSRKKHLRRSNSNNSTLCGRVSLPYDNAAQSDPLPCGQCVALVLTRRHARANAAEVQALFVQREQGALPGLSARLFARCPDPANLWWCSACQAVNPETAFFVESDFPSALCVCGAPCLYYWRDSWLSSVLIGWEDNPSIGNYYPLPLSLAPGDTVP
jgi:hypothetical protein